MKLIALICPTCNRPLQPANEHITTICSQCQQIFLLEQTGLKPVNVQFVTTGASKQQWVPYWVFHGRVRVTKREIQGGGKSGQKASEQLWSQPRYFYVPAWELPLKQLQELGGRLIETQPTFNPVETPTTVQLQPAVITADDARKMIELIVLSIEAKRDDYLQNFTFTVQLSEGQLWALPA